MVKALDNLHPDTKWQKNNYGPLILQFKKCFDLSEVTKSEQNLEKLRAIILNIAWLFQRYGVTCV